MDGVKRLETFPPSPALFCALIESAGEICRYVRSLFFFSLYPPSSLILSFVQVESNCQEH